MSPSSLASASLSQIVVIDMQDRLAQSMNQAELQAVSRNCSILLQSASLLSVPTLFTEQYPKGLGPILIELASWIAQENRIEKTCFSCCGNENFQTHLIDDRPQVILVGMEAHICVLQTAMELCDMGKTVFVVEDAVISRNPSNKNNALHRMRQAGIIVTNTESVVFEWLKVAEGDVFKQISKLVR